ncbi:MAG TPA: CPBP family glutamic-type intramembrane protease, partial [Candidatus Polarisedimenticolia bacterium]|nr:CPBP family glutamic-type intramembrane protease [Candidatus Polarisedimenticolia bacterium]
RAILAPWQAVLRRRSLNPEALRSACEVVFVLSFLLYYIWVLEPRSGPGIRLAAFAFFMAFTLASSYLHGDTAADLGLRIDTLGRALGEAMVVIAPGLLVAFVMGRSLEGGRPLTPERLTVSFLGVYTWAFFQQYGLQCFFNRRLRVVLGHPIGHDVVCAGIFAALHLPNPFLTVVTFGAAYCFCALFRRCPNLFALAAAHALSSSVLYYSLPPAVTHLMRVGPGYLLELRWH